MLLAPLADQKQNNLLRLPYGTNMGMKWHWVCTSGLVGNLFFR